MRRLIASLALAATLTVAAPVAAQASTSEPACRFTIHGHSLVVTTTDHVVAYFDHGVTRHTRTGVIALKSSGHRVTDASVYVVTDNGLLGCKPAR